jgi:probable HAF family extracellular repeat protein
VGFSAVPDWKYEAFRWVAEEGMVGLGDLPGGSFWSDAFAVSADGSTIVGYSRAGSGTQAFRWTAQDGMIGLGDLPGGGTISYALGISADGSTIVGYAHSYLQWEAFCWTGDGGMIGLGIPPGQLRSEALDVSGDGSVIVGRCTKRAFRWTEEDGIVVLESSPSGVLPREAWGISRDGNCIVGRGVGGGAVAAFMWTSARGTEAIQDVLTEDFGLDLGGWKLTEAYDISDDGLAIVGVGINPDGYEEAWIATFREPTPPVADADGPYSVFVGDTLTLDANGSTDVDEDIVSYVWDLDDNGIFETDAGGQAIFDVNYTYLEPILISPE